MQVWMLAPSRSDTELAARWFSYLLAAGGAFIFVALLLLPLPASTDRGSAWLVGAGAVGVSSLVLLLRRHLPPLALPLLLLPAATVLVSSGIVAWGRSPTDGGMFYVWIVLHAAYFLPFWQSVAEIALVGLCYGAALARVGAGEPGFTRWAITLGTLAIAGTVTQRLTRRLRAEVAYHERAAGERERLLELLQTAALTDGLTGLPNRRAWDQQLEHELARVSRQDAELCVAVLDLDHFKLYNDTHGHAGGDELLRAATIAWSEQLRASDLLARHGGEEFTLLLRDCDEAGAFLLVERLRAATPPGQTVSAGLAQWRGEPDPDELLGRADAALYEAKAAGRDRTIIAGSESLV
jgi:diguanylate cyclase (GGDEF)-like protein